MHASNEFLRSLSIVLGVAAITTLLFQRLRQPVVLGYILAGLLVGPHLPFPLVADTGTVQTLSELGVILLMFSLGLEFSFGRLLKVGPVASLVAVLQCSFMLLLGYELGKAFGWTSLEAVYLGAMVAISSTTIIAKVYDDQGIGGRLRELVVGILIVEDLIGILLMAGLTALAAHGGLSPGALADAGLRLGAFLTLLLFFGALLVPRLMRWVTAHGRAETKLVSAVGLCFSVAWLAQAAGYSVALGAFVAGSLIAESGQGHPVEELVRPVRDMFAAVFFVSVGLLIDPALVLEHWQAVLVLTVAVIGGMFASVSVGAFLTGNGIQNSVRAGLSLAQIGEFSFIIAALGHALGATRSFLYPVAAAVSALTTLTTPWLIRGSVPAASWVERHLPLPLQTYAALYGSWVDRLKASKPGGGARSAFWEQGRTLFLEVLLLAALLAGLGLYREPLAAGVASLTALPDGAAHWVLGLGALFLATPFALGIARLTKAVALGLSEHAFPRAPEEQVDIDAAPRRALAVTLRTVILAAAGLPVLAAAQTLMPGVAGGALFIGAVGMGAWALWKGAENLHGHVRAGSQMIVEALAVDQRAGHADPHALDVIRPYIGGLGEPQLCPLQAGQPGAGRSLQELDLSGLSGAAVLAIVRGEHGTVNPTPQERLRPGDVVVLAGTAEAVAAAKLLLNGAL